ncbi:MAG TPA: tripartite tricarboxylate transporter permease [Hyphomicrobiaceae bacterium]|nr:tripartite tricarboxylate transporter permease [Hyphomicrobiaceae bacterium]
MDLVTHLAHGFSIAVTPLNLTYCLFGVTLGTLIGVLPGIGPAATLAMLLPMTFSLSPVTSLIMLAGIYYGSQYGGSTTAILINTPGEASSVVTTLDGYQMARRGRAGAALGVAAIGSFAAGSVATLVVALFAPPLSSVALSFGAPEYFSLMVFGLMGAMVLASGSLLRSLGMVLLGLAVGLVGPDINSGKLRFTYGIEDLFDGINVVVVAMGLFAFAEIVANLEHGEKRETFTKAVRGLLPSREDLKRIIAPVLRGTAIGSLLGVLPGGGPLLASFAAYTVEKKVADDASRFGQGAIEGVAAPEAANNAGAQTSFIPLLTLGIPTSATMALMLGAMTMQGINPGPQVLTKSPDLFWGMIASMWIGNAMLVILNLPLIGIWIRLLTVPYRLLYPAILVFCCIGLTSLDNRVFDVHAAAVFGLAGYLLFKLGCEPAPFLLGFILGPGLEENLRRALVLSRGDPSVFITQPISAALLLASVAMLAMVVGPAVRKWRTEVFREG